MQTTLISGGRILTPFEQLENREILLGGGGILQISEPGSHPHPDRRIDADGAIIAPGFLDVHVQGAGGADVLDASDNALKTIGHTCARFGVTGYLATTVYRPEGDNTHLEVAATACRSASQPSGSPEHGAKPLGIHIEGPFIARGKRGMIQEDCIAPVDSATMRRIRKLTGEQLRMLTLAPELPGALDLITGLRIQEVIPSFGHSEADYGQTLAGIKAGIRHATHLYNAMRTMHHRDPGPIPALLETPGLSVQLIPDGAHIHPPMLRLALERLRGDRLVLISDGMQAMGLPDGRYVYNGLEYESRDGTARYLDGTLIGTSLGMSQLIARFIEHTGCSLAEAVRAGSYNPACVLGLQERKGRVKEGWDADLVILNQDLSVRMTILEGRCIYEA